MTDSSPTLDFIAPTDAQLERFIPHVRDFSEFLAASDFTVSGFSKALGTDGIQALDSGNPQGVVELLKQRRKANLAGAIDDLIQLFVIGDPTPLPDSLPPALATALIDAAICNPANTDEPALYTPGIDIRPILAGDCEQLVFSDRDASMTVHVPGPDHVLGAGRASRSLMDISPTFEVNSVLDLGAGCGIQSLGQHASDRIVATDIHPRANIFARLTFAANGVNNAEVRQGSWFCPVADEKFDRIISNPPFVVGLPEVLHTYRDSGLNLDGATELMMREAGTHLTLEGTGHMLGAWVHTESESWQQRLARWIPDDGLEVWAVQRDFVSPTTYVSTWLKDESIDIRTTEGRRRTAQWLEHFEREGVTGVGFGYITMQKIDGPSSILCEEMTQPLAGSFHAEATEYLARAQWLRDKSPEEIHNARFQLRPGIALERVSVADTESQQGFVDFALRISRTDGPCWTHDVDEALVQVLSALHPQASLKTAVEILAMLGAIDEHTVPEVLDAIVPLVVDLVRHGLLLPSELCQ